MPPLSIVIVPIPYLNVALNTQVESVLGRSSKCSIVVFGPILPKYISYTFVQPCMHETLAGFRPSPIPLFVSS